jgi:predicted site-specific integrase-resolvase
MATEKLSPEGFLAKSKPKRAALYCRASTSDQHPETQLYDLREMAKQRGYEIVHEYTDVISGANQSDRDSISCWQMPGGTTSIF